MLDQFVRGHLTERSRRITPADDPRHVVRSCGGEAPPGEGVEIGLHRHAVEFDRLLETGEVTGTSPFCQA